MRGLRLWLLALVTAIAFAAQAGSKSGSHQIYFPFTRDGGEPEGHIRLVVPIDKRGARRAFTVVSHKRGSVKRVGFHWSPDDEAYEASFRARPNAEGTFDLAVVAPHDPTILPVRLGRRDVTTIEGVTGKDAARVDAVRPYGLDLDGDRRADLAFAEVCGWLHDDGFMCQGSYQAVMRRDEETWHVAPACHPDIARVDEPCFSY